MQVQGKRWRWHPDPQVTVLKRIWNRELGEVAVAVRKSSNEYDRYAVAILESETCCTVGHLSREIERYFSDDNKVPNAASYSN